MSPPFRFLSGCLTCSVALASAVSGTAGAGVRINEVVADNGSVLADRNGDYNDWVELHNSSEVPVQLEGWHLTDDPEALTKWRFPAASIPAGGYLVVHCSGKTNANIFNPEIHALFGLAVGGEYLALVEPDGLTIADEWDPGFPPLARDVSYGRLPDAEEFALFSQPTPGAANTTTAFAGFVEPVSFSLPHGWIDTPAELVLSCATPETRIRFTLNGNIPSLFTAHSYTGPLRIETTTIVRAVAERTGWITSPLATASYLVLDAVMEHPVMHRGIVDDPVYGPLVREGLRIHPTVSLVSQEDALIATRESRASIEFIPPAGDPGFQIDGAAKLVGGHSLANHPKNNIRLYFRRSYGPPNLRYPLYRDHPFTTVAAEEFDQLQLRSGSHDSVFYLGSNQQLPSNAQYLRNRWMNDMQLAMGHESLRGRWVQVFFNGVYSGHFQLMERPNRSYFASYLGGDEDAYLATNRGQPTGNSNMAPWAAMISSTDNFEDFLQRVDIESYLDYMLLNYYAGNDWDWNPNQNWTAGGPLLPGAGGFKFISWDADIVLRRTDDNNLSRAGPESLFPRLLRHAAFRQLLADRIYLHFENDGIFAPERVAAIYNYRAEQIRVSIVAETARWGNGSWTRDRQWQAELDRLNQDFFPRRTGIVLSQMRQRGWVAPIAPPGFGAPSGKVEEPFELQLFRRSIFDPGDIYFTLDESDPRGSNGEPSASALLYNEPVPLTGRVTVLSRARRDADWSALTRADYIVGFDEPSAVNLALARFDYHPAGPNEPETGLGFIDRDLFEFLELLNIGHHPIDLTSLRISDGVSFDFSASSLTDLLPGQRAFVVKNILAFQERYGTAHFIAGQYEGNLANSGERVAFTLADETIVFEFTYDDRAPWPSAADGDGPFLVLTDPYSAPDPSEASSWRLSRAGEQPGSGIGFLHAYAAWSEEAFPAAFPERELTQDPDGDGLLNLWEFAAGGDPLSPDPSPLRGPLPTSDGNEWRLLLRLRSGLEGLQPSVQFSADLDVWTDLTESEVQYEGTAGAPSAGAVTEHAWLYTPPAEAQAPSGYFRFHLSVPSQ